jgi:hypothetical protein
VSPSCTSSGASRPDREISTPIRNREIPCGQWRIYTQSPSRRTRPDVAWRDSQAWLSPPEPELGRSRPAPASPPLELIVRLPSRGRPRSERRPLVVQLARRGNRGSRAPAVHGRRPLPGVPIRGFGLMTSMAWDDSRSGTRATAACLALTSLAQDLRRLRLLSLARTRILERPTGVAQLLLRRLTRHRIPPIRNISALGHRNR